MDRYLVPVEPSPETVKPPSRIRWKRTVLELNGRFELSYRRDSLALLVQSYSEVGAFPHLYHINGAPCATHVNRIMNATAINQQFVSGRYGVSALDFDKKGIFLASVTKSGCLMVHDFESLYCMSNERPKFLEDETKHLLHIFPCQQLDAVRWNPANQDEVACTSLKRNEVLIFDIAYISSEPIEVLRKRPTLSIHGSDTHKGFSDVIFPTNGDSSVIASDTHGSVHVWDRRANNLPCLELATNSRAALNSIELHYDNQIIFGADKHGVVHIWDLRGGRISTAFISNKEPYALPLASIKLASLLERIELLKAQSDIVMMEIHSIDKDPSSAHRLAFHLDDGWSGVLEVSSTKVTHIHCPPPAWLNDSNLSANLSYLRKPSWISATGIYAVGSSFNDGLYLLDFCPDPSSPSHVDYRDDKASTFRVRQNRFVATSEPITACAVHPSNGSIVAGTKQASLLLVSQKQKSWKGEDDCLTNN
ncbi:hypothetical protein V2J09_018476 [Rumex salicifolius]